MPSESAVDTSVSPSSADSSMAPAGNLPPSLSRSKLRQTLDFIRDPFAVLHQAREELGDIFSLRLFGLGYWVFVCSPELNREMFKADEGQLAAGVANRKFIGHMMGPNATFSLDGDEHSKRRRMIFPMLNGRKTLDRIPEILESADRVFASWPHKRPFPMMDASNRMTLEIIVRGVFGRLPNERYQRMMFLAQRYFEEGLRSQLLFFPGLQWDLGRFSPWGKVVWQKKELFDLVQEEVEEGLAGKGGDGVLHALIEGEFSDGRKLEKEALVHECVNIIFGAQESTGKILAWTILGILTHPEVRAKVEEEIRQVVGDGVVAPEHIDELKYIEAACNEGMRFKPASPIAGTRLALQDTEVGGYLIPAGSAVTQGFAVMTQRGDIFPLPKGFNPDQNFFEQKPPAYSFNPFGGGRRMCLGKGFAMLELKVIIAHLFGRINLQPAFDELRGERVGFLFQPENGGQVQLME